MRALVGHPRIIGIDGDSPDEPSALELDKVDTITLVRAPLGFAAVPDGDQIRIEPSLEGARLSLPERLAWLERAARAVSHLHRRAVARLRRTQPAGSVER